MGFCMASQDTIAQIRSRIDIVELIGGYVSLKKMGKYFKSPCPFHQEKTPSFVVSPDRQRWHCFGACHEGGDIFTFLMKWDNLTFPEAIMELGKRAGISVEDLKSGSAISDVDARMKSQILEINELAARYYHYVLTKDAHGAAGRAYLETRRVSDAIANSFCLGYAPESWDNLVQYLHKKGYDDTSLLASGMCVEGTRGLYDRFRGRLMFPIYNTLEQVIGFSGRLIAKSPDGKEQAKYVNTPETLAYHKRESLYGIHKAKDAIRKSGSVIVVEGEFDMITPFAHGIENIVAIKGSAFTTEQLKTLKRYAHKLIFALDADPAGIAALKKTIPLAQGFEFELYVLAIPDGKDPDEAVKHDFISFKRALEYCVPVYDFIIDQQLPSLNLKDPFSKNEFAESILPIIDVVKNPIVKQHYMQRISNALELDQSSLQSLQHMLKQKKKTPHAYVQTVEAHKVTSQSRYDLLQKYVLAMAITAAEPSHMIKTLRKYLEAADFTQPPYAQLFEYITSQGAPVTALATGVPNHLRDLYDELYLYPSVLPDTDAQPSYERTVLELAKIATTEVLKKAMSESEGDTDTTLAAAQKRLSVLNLASLPTSL